MKCRARCQAMSWHVKTGTLPCHGSCRTAGMSQQGDSWDETSPTRVQFKTPDTHAAVQPWSCISVLSRQQAGCGLRGATVASAETHAHYRRICICESSNCWVRQLPRLGSLCQVIRGLTFRVQYGNCLLYACVCCAPDHHLLMKGGPVSQSCVQSLCRTCLGCKHSLH